MSRDRRSRVLLGAGIPMAALLFLGILILAFSRILLAVPEELAPWVALLFATNILVGCALAATIPGTRGFAFLIGVLIATIVIGGIAGLVVGPRPVESLAAEGEHASGEGSETGQPIPIEPGAGGEEPAPVPAAGGGGEGEPAPAEASIVAEGLAFDTSELSFPADTPVVLDFDNRDQGTPHNFAIYASQGGAPVFQGEIVSGPATTEYDIPQTPVGEYYFQCDVHPTMNGTLTVG